MQNFPYQTNARLALASLVTIGLIAIIPFLLPHHGLATAFYSEWAAFALGLAACFPLLSRNFWLHLAIPQSAVWLSALVVLIALQVPLVGHAYATQAWLPGIYLAWAAVLVILSAWIREQLGLERALVVFAWALVAGGALSAAIGVAQHVDVTGVLASFIDAKGSSIHGNTGQRNHFATQIALASFALIYLRAENKVNRLLAILLLAIFALVLTASSSRAAAVYLVAGFLLALFSYRATRTVIHRRLLHGTALLLALFLLFQYLLPPLNDGFRYLLAAMGFDVGNLDMLVTLQRSASDGIDVRLSEWRKAWLMFLESPLWGVGIGHYGWRSFNYQALPEFATVSKPDLFNHSHNLILQVLAELGIAGLLALILLAVAWLRQVLPLWKNPSHWLLLTLAAVLLLHSNVEYPLWYSYFLGTAAILLGLGDRSAVKIKFTPSLGQFAAGATLVLSGAILMVTFQGFQHINHSSTLVLTSTPQQATETLQAISKNPLLTPWAEATISYYVVPDKSALDRQLAMTTRVMEYRPTPLAVNRQIVYLALAGKATEAHALMEKSYAAYTSDFPKYACSWKQSPAEEVRQLWEQAGYLTGDSIECRVNSKTGPALHKAGQTG